jgi:hypothetical protein
MKMASFLIVIPWVDLAEESAGLGWREVEARDIDHAREIAQALLSNESELLDVLVGPGTSTDVDIRPGERLLEAYGARVGLTWVFPSTSGACDLAKAAWQ